MRTKSAPDEPRTAGTPPGAARQVVVDAVLAALVLTVVSTAVTSNVGDDSTGPPLVAYTFGVLLGGLMFVRRRWPVAALLGTAATLLGYYTLAFPPIGLAVPVAAALYSAAEQGRIRWAAGTAVALLALSTPVRIGEGDDLGYVLGFELVTSILVMAAVIALGDSVRSRRGWRAELDKQARAAMAEREREAERRVQLERLRIARDLHDLLGHTVSVISLHTDVAREALREDPATAERSLAAARTACSGVMRELRTTLGALRGTGEGGTGGEGAGSGDGDGAPVPGLDRLDELVEPATAAGLDVRVRTTGVPVRLPAVSDVAVYRVIQESLSNVVRHAHARTVTLDLKYGPTELVVCVVDDGRGADGTGRTAGGWGIIGMRERLSLLGGSLSARPRRGGGFVVEARVPLDGRP